jgi:hypothetical protein
MFFMLRISLLSVAYTYQINTAKKAKKMSNETRGKIPTPDML